MVENKQNNGNKERGEGLKPDPETLHTTDPQKKMEGPVSSSIHKAGKAFATDETKEEADRNREEHM